MPQQRTAYADFIAEIEDGVSILEARGHTGPISAADAIKALNEQDIAEQAQQQQGRRTDLYNNVKEVEAPPVGNTRQYALRRLRKSRPDLHRKVLSGDLTLITLQHKHEAGSDEIHQRMEHMRQEVRRELHEALEQHGANQWESDGRNNITSTKIDRGTSENYTLRRLRRDAPELAEQVIAGKVSANQAAIQAGFRKQPIYVPDDIGKAARVLARHFDVTALIDALARRAPIGRWDSYRRALARQKELNCYLTNSVMCVIL